MWVEKNGPTFRVRDLVGGRKVTVAAGYRTKTAANSARVQLEADALRGEALVPRGGDMTVGEWVDVWWPSYAVRLKPSARISSEGIIRRYIRPMLGHIPLGDMVPLVVQSWVADLQAGRHGTGRRLSPKTIGNAHGQLHTILKAAVSQRLIRSNPCEHTGLPPKQHHEMMFLTEPQADRIVSAVPEYWRPLILFFLGTGFRWSEAVGLRVRDVDVLARRVRHRKQTQELADTAEIVDEEPKSQAGRRTITITRDIAELLIPLTTRGSDERVFTAPKGGVVRQRGFYRIWMKARASAGLDGLRIHDLRHTHAAWLISAGVPLTAIQRRLGHKSIAVTSDLYGHLMPEVDTKIDDAVDSALGKIDFRGQVGESNRPQPTATHPIPQQRAGQDASQAI